MYKLTNLAAQNTATVGASLAHVHVPGREIVPDELKDEIEIGMGIHNEEGFGRVKTDLPGLISTMLKQLLDQSDKDRAYINVQKSDEVVLLVNNLGAVSALELGAITAEVVDQLAATYSILPTRLLSGTYMTSLNGMGFSITLLKVVDKSFVNFIDAPADAAGWSPAVQPSNWARGIDTSQAPVDTATEKDEANPVSSKLTSTLRRLSPTHCCYSLRILTFVVNPELAAQRLTSALHSLIESEAQITKYDTLVGDGDCGLCLKTGAEAVLKYIGSAPVTSDAVRLVHDIAQVVESSMDGTSGALYAIFTNALASGLQSSSTGAQQEITPQIWAAGLKAALVSLAKYTPAQPGDRTVVDALAPFVATLAQTLDLGSAVKAAEKGCESTKGMEASLGRSVYVSVEGWNSCPDPGAYGLVKLLEGLLN